MRDVLLSLLVTVAALALMALDDIASSLAIIASPPSPSLGAVLYAPPTETRL